MRTAHVHTVHASVATTACRSGGPRSDVQVGHQMSVAGRTHLTFPGWGLSYNVTYPMMHVMLPTYPPVEQNDRQTPVKTLPSRNFVGLGNYTVM